jgi:hypothetical protein
MQALSRFNRALQEDDLRRRLNTLGLMVQALHVIEANTAADGRGW